MKHLIKFFKGNFFILVLSITLSLISEGLELVTNIIHPFVTGVIYSVIGIIIGMFLEKIRNNLLFYDRIQAVVKKMKLVSSGFHIPAKAIQDIMVTIVDQFAKAFATTRKVYRLKAPPRYSENVKLPCSICKTIHETEIDGNCSNCRLPAEIWAGFDQ